MKRLCILLIIALLCLVTASPNLFSQTLAPAKTRVLIKNKQLKSENKKLNIELKKLKKELKQKELEIQKLNKKNLSLQKRNKLVLEKIVPFKQALNQEKRACDKKKELWDIERAILYERLGGAFAQTEAYTQAIQAYKTSLSFNPDNAKVHYNIAILYEHAAKNSEKAVFHLNKYLELKPNAKNKNEVERLIKVIKRD